MKQETIFGCEQCRVLWDAADNVWSLCPSCGSAGELIWPTPELHDFPLEFAGDDVGSHDLGTAN